VHHLLHGLDYSWLSSPLDFAIWLVVEAKLVPE